MKKVLSLVLVLSMVLGSFGFAFAAPADDYARLIENEILIGDNGNFDWEGNLTRAQYAVIALRLAGFSDAEVVALNETAPFTDLTGVSSWAAPYVGKAYQEGLVQGHSATTYAPADNVTYVQALTVLMRALGYEDGVDLVDYPTGYFLKAVELGIANASIPATTEITRAQMAAAMELTLDTNLKGEETTLAQELGIEPAAPAEPETLEVDSVEANSAKSFLVKFNKAVADTDDIEFSVKRGTSTISVTTKWNDAKTEATLENATKFAEGIYTVTVTDKSAEATVELVKVDREITTEKVVDVEFDSDVISRLNDAEGIVGYTVRNQYGEDVTDSALGRSLNWIVSTEDFDVDPKAGVITFIHDISTSFNQLKDLRTVVVTVRDSSVGFVQTKTFTVSETISIVSEINLLGIVDEKGNDVDFVFDAAKTYYLEFEAFDGNGKKVEYASALQAKVYGTTDVFSVRSTNTIVTPIVEKHPDTGKAAIRLQLDAGRTVDYDTPVSFIAMAPFAGKTATLNTTLLKSARVDRFTLQAPVVTASVSKSFEIPFTAVDQNGEEVTKFDDLQPHINLSPDSTTNPNSRTYFVRQSDGTAKLYGYFDAKGLVYITASVKNSVTGSFSQISVDVKEASVPTSIAAIRHTNAFTYNGSTATGATYNPAEAASWSRDLSHFTITDQFDRALDLSVDAEAKFESTGTPYQVRITSSDPAVIQVVPGSEGATVTTDGVILAGFSDENVTFRAGMRTGTATITYELIGSVRRSSDNVILTNQVIDSATTIAYNVNPADIRSITLSPDHTRDLYVTGESSLYATSTTAGVYSLTGVGGRMVNLYTLYGVLGNGMQVRLPNTMRAGFTVTGTNFQIRGANEVVSYDIGSASTATATVTGYVYGKNGVLAGSSEIKANTAAPAPTAVVTSYENDFLRATGVTVDNDIITMSVQNFTDYFSGNSVYAFSNLDGTAQTAAGVRFQVNTQYGRSNSGLLNRVVVSSPNGSTGLAVSNATGVVTGSVSNGDQYTITAIAANGMTKVITINIRN